MLVIVIVDCGGRGHVRLVLDRLDLIDIDAFRGDDLDLVLFGRGNARIARHLSRPPAAADARCLCRRGRSRSRGGWRGRGRISPAARWRRRLLFRTDALLALPSRADSRDLIVREQGEMAAHRDVHLAKQRDYVVAGYPELAGHVVYAKLAQTVLLAGSNRVRSMPPRRGLLDESANASRELWIDDPNGGRRFPSKRGAQLGRRRTFNYSNVLRPKHRHDFVEAMP